MLEREEYRDAIPVGITMLAALICGAAVTVFGSGSAWAPALLWAGACSVVGWVLGFLFGIPRSLSSDTARTGSVGVPVEVSKATDKTTNANIAAPALGTPDIPERAASPQTPAPPNPTIQNQNSPGPSTAVNTNLEQISDWLTKIIVGVTLVENQNVIVSLRDGAEQIAGSLGGNHQVSFAYALMIYFSASGFLGCHLLTRLFLQQAFNNADAGLRNRLQPTVVK